MMKGGAGEHKYEDQVAGEKGSSQEQEEQEAVTGGWIYFLYHPHTPIPDNFFFKLLFL